MGAVENGQLKYLTVTALERAMPETEGCPLRFAYKEVFGHKEPMRSWQGKGDDIQAQLDHYLATGENVLGRIAAAGRHLLPPPGPDLLIDLGLNGEKRPPPRNGEKVSFFSPDSSRLRAAGVPLIGFTDLINLRGQTVLEGEHGVPITVTEPGVPELIDHKTSKNLEKWGKTEADLELSPQITGYSRFVLDETGADQIRQSFNNFQTEGAPKASKVSKVVSRAEISARWAKVEAFVDTMKSVAAAKREQDVKGNLDVCNSFGGCPHQSYCWQYQQQTPLRKIDMASLLRNRTPAAAAPPAPNGAAPGGQTPWISPGAPPAPQPPPQAFAPQTQTPPVQYAPAAPAQVPAAPPIPAQYAAPPAPMAAPPIPVPIAPSAQMPRTQILDVIAASQAQQGQQYFVGGDHCVFLCSSAGKQSFLRAAGGVLNVDYDLQIQLVPQGLVQPALTQAAFGSSVNALPPAQPPLAPPAPIAPPLMQMAPPAVTAPAPVVQYASPPAPVAQPVAAPSAPAHTVAQPQKRGRGKAAQAAANTAQAVASAAPQPAPTPATGLTLYVNAIPNGPFVHLDPYIFEATSELAQHFGVSDLRAAPETSPIGYARWKGALADMVRAQPPEPGSYVVFTRGSEFAEVIVEALAPLVPQGQFVRGL